MSRSDYKRSYALGQIAGILTNKLVINNDTWEEMLERSENKAG